MEPEGYRRQINTLGLGKLRKMRVENQSDAKKVLKRVRNFQKRLRQIKREINLDMKTIRAGYREKSANAGEGLSTVVSLLGKRKLAGSIRADAKRRLKREREQVLAPYEKIKLEIDNLLTKLDRLKMQIDEYIQNVKTKSESAKVALKSKAKSKAFCPRCGDEINSSDKFCRNCGKKLHSP